MTEPARVWTSLGAFAAVISLAACDRGAGVSGEAVKAPPPASPAIAPPPPTAPPTPAAAPAPPPVTLILTWMPPDQPPQTTQMGFRDLAACERARAEAVAESQRLASEAGSPGRAATAAPVERHYVGNTLISGAPPPPPTVAPAAPPRVAAICAGG